VIAPRPATATLYLLFYPAGGRGWMAGRLSCAPNPGPVTRSSTCRRTASRQHALRSNDCRDRGVAGDRAHAPGAAGSGWVGAPEASSSGGPGRASWEYGREDPPSSGDAMPPERAKAATWRCGAADLAPPRRDGPAGRQFSLSTVRPPGSAARPPRTASAAPMPRWTSPLRGDRGCAALPCPPTK